MNVQEQFACINLIAIFLVPFHICIYIYICRVIPLQAPCGPEGGRGIALFFHDRGTRRGWVVSSTLQPHFTPREIHGTHFTGGWVGLRAGLNGRKNLVPTGIRSRTVQAVAQSLYRLSYWAIYIYISTHHIFSFVLHNKRYVTENSVKPLEKVPLYFNVENKSEVYLKILTVPRSKHSISVIQNSVEAR